MSEQLVKVYAVSAILTCLFFIYKSLQDKNWIVISISISILSSGILIALFGESFPISLFQIVLLVFFVQGLIHFLYKGTRIKHLDYYKLTIPFLALISFSLLYSKGIEGGLINFIRLSILMGFTFLLIQLELTKAQLKKVFVFIIIVSSIISCISILENILNPEIAIQNILASGLKIDRASAGGIYNDPNRFAVTLVLPLIYIFIKLLEENPIKSKAFYIIVFIILLVGLVSSYSRSAFFSLALSLVFVSLYMKKLKQLSVLSLLGLLVVVSVPAFRDSFTIYIARILDIVSGNIDTSSNIRIILGYGAISMFIDSNMLGVGFGSFSENIIQYFSTQQTVGVVEPHNILYTILAELGLIGFLLFCLILYKLFRDGITVLRRSDEDINTIALTLFAALISYMIFYQFYDGALYDANIYLIIGLMLILKLRQESTQSQKD